MSSLGKSLLVLVIAIGFSGPAFAQPKADAGSGPTSGAASPNDAGSGPTKGAKPNTDATAASNPAGSTENSAGVTPGPKSTGGSQPVTPATPEKKQ
jgi:hypothetical protein